MLEQININVCMQKYQDRKRIPVVKMEMMLQTQNLCKYFRKQKAVNNVSLNIEKGQIYGLLGPNGA